MQNQLLDDLFKTMKSEIELKNITIDSFNSYNKCVSGKEICDWIQDKTKSREEALFLGKMMLRE